MIKSREGSKSTLRDVDGNVNSHSRSRSRENKKELDEAEIQAKIENPASPKDANDEHRVQKLI